MASNWNLPVAFHFQVEFQGEPRIGIVPFKEASGFNTEMELETVIEGGVNDFEHKLPKQIKHGNLVFKGAVVLVESNLSRWIKQTLENNFNQPIQCRNIKISLLNEEHEPIYNWTCNNAYPVKWEVESLDSEKNSVLIETFELAYQTIKRM